MAVHFKKLGASRNYREESGEFLCDGMKLLEEAVGSGVVIPAILSATPIPFPLSLDTRVFYADRTLIDSLSPLKNAQDILFSCKMRDRETGETTPSASRTPLPRGEFGRETGDARVFQGMLDKGGTHILLDNVQDPGNVGAIIRSASAFSIKSVVLYGACADAYNPKTIRASMGAIFRQKICKMDLDMLAEARNGGVKFIGSALCGDCRAIFNVGFENAVVAIGSEGSGLTAEIHALCSELVTIPIADGCDSLNAAVAAAIIMWEASAAKQRREETGNRE